MHLITILLIVIGILAAFSGAVVFFGSLKSNRARAAWYFLAAIFAALWTISISNLIASKSNIDGLVTMHINWTFISAIMLDAAFLGFGAWGIKYGKLITILFLIFGVVLSSLILVNPGLLYSDIAFTNAGNGPVIAIGPLFFAYAAYFGAIVPVIVIAFYRQYVHARSKRSRISNLVAVISYAFSSIVILIADLVLILLKNYSAVWLGPLAVATMILVIYYTVLRYRSINLSLRWLKIFSYVIVVISIAIIYMIIFSIVFAALFRGSTPSVEVIVLNFIMIMIFIALIPAMNGLVKFIRKLVIDQYPKAGHSDALPDTQHSTARHATHSTSHPKAKSEPHKHA